MQQPGSWQAAARQSVTTRPRRMHNLEGVAVQVYEWV